MASYTGNSHHATRIQRLEEERKQRNAEVESQKAALTTSVAGTPSVGFEAKFAAHTESVEDLLKKDTVGLVTFSDFKARREHLEKCAADERQKRGDERREHEASERQRKLKRANKLTLSFAGDEDDEDESPSEADQPHSPTNQSVPKRSRLGKNPHVDTSFVPDRDKELAEQAERERLKQDWINEQETIKDEMIKITYSYWDGAGHRRQVQCKKGCSVGKFLAMVQQEFHQLRTVSPDMLMLIKEDLIIPHHYTFYDFVVTKARGKSGPLFNFGVHEDIRLVSDATKEKEDAHAAKVVERRWYERNRHIFPASRWEVYDPTKRWDSYTIHGGDVN